MSLGLSEGMSLAAWRQVATSRWWPCCWALHSTGELGKEGLGMALTMGSMGTVGIDLMIGVRMRTQRCNIVGFILLPLIAEWLQGVF